jgi:hypothetical protein
VKCHEDISLETSTFALLSKIMTKRLLAFAKPFRKEPKKAFL